MLQQEQEYLDFDGIPEEEIETVYITVSDHDPEPRFWQNWQWSKCDKGRILNLFVQMLALAMFSWFLFLPGTLLYHVQTIRVPAVFLPVQKWTATVALLPTGNKTFPATQAHGVLTIYNGSILSQQLPAHFILTTSNGIEIATEQAIVIPGAKLPILGETSVSAYAVLPGASGNITPYTINQNYGTDIEVKNLTSFDGGHDTYSKIFVTSGDQAKALGYARQHLQREQTTQRQPGLLATPCTETVKQTATNVTVFWQCAYATYKAPVNAKVLSAHLQGNVVMLQIETVVQPA